MNICNKKSLLAGLALSLALVASTQAQDVDGRQGLSEEDRQARQAVINQYDINQDGVLNKSEQKTLNKTDKQTLARTGGIGTSGKNPAALDADSKRKQDHGENGARDRDRDRERDQKGQDSADDLEKPAKGGETGKGNKAGKEKGGNK